jgi:hypothetical protein
MHIQYEKKNTVQLQSNSVLCQFMNQPPIYSLVDPGGVSSEY